ncbi:hypothetical protein NXV28_00135 [Bacteroides ovatus]|uniref:hypothetical protein n=1 Tax=Bacteroides ovatus TaxID=28116 RepID=UPI002165F3A1|nr:hypothetical protein [Bacteroides ovatus]MCS2799154.1 hypothetical protein [Bacteroides ovatus]
MMDKLANGSISNISQYNPVLQRRNVEAMLNGDPTDGWDKMLLTYCPIKYSEPVIKHNVTIRGGSDRWVTLFCGLFRSKGNIDNFSYKRLQFKN